MKNSCVEFYIDIFVAQVFFDHSLCRFLSIWLQLYSDVGTVYMLFIKILVFKL